ncbi:DUF2332 family protein [Nocardioides sp. B-3]|nr:DUF2332 family protein [Nocardioides sp. B-3]UUZ59635.1 DUF2332 family protein [Nocardioides sp. B-3]
MSVLLHLNGAPGVGKSTVAERLVASRPGWLNCDIDVLRTLLGGWRDDFVGAGARARPLAGEMMAAQLATGRGVVLPQLIMEDRELAQFRSLATVCGVPYVHVFLEASDAELAMRWQRRSDQPWVAASQRILRSPGGNDAVLMAGARPVSWPSWTARCSCDRTGGASTWPSSRSPTCCPNVARMELDGDIADRYRDFAAYAEGDSACFVDWAHGVADDPEVHVWLAGLPRLKQQPNLVFAAARWHGAVAPERLRRAEADAARARVADQGDARRARDADQRGRPARDPGAGARTGGRVARTAEPDRGGRQRRAVPVSRPLRLRHGRPSASSPVPGDRCSRLRPPETCRSRAATPRSPGVEVRTSTPSTYATTTRWRGWPTLVWPEQQERRDRLERAVRIAREEPPSIVKGDLFDALPGLLAEAGRHGTPVVFHSAVIAYLEVAERERFHELMTGLVAAGSAAG